LLQRVYQSLYNQIHGNASHANFGLARLWYHLEEGCFLVKEGLSMLEEVLPGLIRIPLNPLEMVNVYLLGDVLVDSGPPYAAKQILEVLDGRDVSAHALTHVHPDHQGSSHAVCEQLELPLWCGGDDLAAMESGDLSTLMPNPQSWIAKLSVKFSGPAHPVSRSLQEGDQVGGFTVINTPGHTPGHLSFWREADRALVLGDVLFHRNPITQRLGLQEPFKLATIDPAMNRQSARKLAKLEPAVICFGHGPPLKDTLAFLSYIASLSIN
jgi:glyoxylase-like metal-dependent hydrolase (beta-lactamase superfamily II)